jgi:hypothetical protein
MDTDVETGVEADGEGGIYYDSEDDAAADADLNAGADVEAGTDLDTAADDELETDTDVEADPMAEDGTGGPYSESRDDATSRLGNLDGLADGNVSDEVDALETDGLNDRVLEEVEKAKPDADASSETDIEGETTY